MRFTHRRECRRRRRAAVALAGGLAGLSTVLSLLAGAGPATAAPLDEPFVGGMGWSGPTDGDPAAIYWNPAALGLARGFQILVAGSGRRTSTTVQRQGTGVPNGQPKVSNTDLTQPIQWPPGPGTFIGLSSDIGGDRFALGFAAYMPFLQQTSYPIAPDGAGDEPTRYHALKIDLRNLALVPALAIRFGSDFRLGVAPGFLFSTGHLLFAEDTALDRGADGLASDCFGSPCGVENPAAAARYDISSGHGITDAKFSFTLAGGIYWRRRNFAFGLSYQSRPLGSDVTGVEVAGRDTTITVPPRDGGGGQPLTCGAGQSTHCVFGDVSYRLPDIFIGGVAWRIGQGLELTGMARWLRMHTHDRIDIRLTGPTLDAAGLPQRVVLYRDFQDVLDLRVRLSYWWHERVRIGGMLRLETSAVDNAAVNPAAIDALKVQPLVLAQVRLGNRFWLGAGYGLTIMPSVTVNHSAFDPQLAIDCVRAGGNLDDESCRARQAGRARPSANGTYTALTHDLGLTFAAKF
jgi:long-subunit fatty acid transport protein